MSNEQQQPGEGGHAMTAAPTAATPEMPKTQPQAAPGVYPELGALPEGALVTEDGLAEMLGKCRMSIRRAVKRGELPPAARIMGKRCWTAGALVRHIEAKLERAQVEAERRARRLSELPT
jgi:hypothetical protein